jgi:hypothetical protein
MPRPLSFDIDIDIPCGRKLCRQQRCKDQNEFHQAVVQVGSTFAKNEVPNHTTTSEDLLPTGSDFVFSKKKLKRSRLTPSRIEYSTTDYSLVSTVNYKSNSLRRRSCYAVVMLYTVYPDTNYTGG